MPASQSVSGSSSHPSQQDPGLQERVSAAFEKLAESAAELNAVSDEVAKPISTIDRALQKLNLGVSAWVEFAGEFDHNTGSFWDHSLGYAKVAREWGISIRTRRGNDFHNDVDDADEELWRFNDAPRSHRLDAMDKLPALLEELAKTSNETAQALKSKVASAKQTAATVRQMAVANPGGQPGAQEVGQP